MNLIRSRAFGLYAITRSPVLFPFLSPLPLPTPSTSYSHQQIFSTLASSYRKIPGRTSDDEFDNGVWPLHLLNGQLERKLNPHKIIQLTDQVAQRLRQSPSKWDWGVVHRLLRHIARHRMSVLVPHVLDMVLKRLEVDDDDKAVSFRRFLGSLRVFADDPLPESVSRQIEAAALNHGSIYHQDGMFRRNTPIGRMVASKSEPNGDIFIRTIVPFLQSQHMKHAWSILFSKLSEHHQISTEELVVLWDNLPSKARQAPVMTPLMQAFHLRGENEKALQVWDEMKGHDSVALSVASEVVFSQSGLDAAVTFVDSWSKKIKLDTRNINTLLKMCRNQGRPSVGIRLWTSAPKRYKNVYLDDISLTLLLDSIRFQRKVEEDFNSRWRDLLSITARTDDELYDGILDPPGFIPGPTWRKGRDIFRQVVLTNWPYLSEIQSPLNVGLFTYQPKTIDKTLPSPEARYTHVIPSPNTFASYISLLGMNRQISEIPIVLAWMKELDIRPSWKSMCTALTYVDEAQGPRRWVRYPHLPGVGGGGVQLVGDADILRRWLKDWLGDGLENFKGQERSIVPSDKDVAANYRRLSERVKR